METVKKPGAYKNFSGEIIYQNTNCVVRNADFVILNVGERTSIVFDDAVFVSGKITYCDINNGLNLGVVVWKCNINYMINKAGSVVLSEWKDGVFEGGKFMHSTWHDGVWIRGVWNCGADGSRNKRIEPPDRW